jgi:hypothetical protein
MDNSQTTTPATSQPQADLTAVQHRYQMLLDRWHQTEPRSLRAEIVQVPSNENGNIAIVRAIAETAQGSFAAFGSADALMVGSDRAVVLLEWAELLAKTNALRDACNAASLAFGFEQSAPRGPVYSAAVVENGRVMASTIGQPLASAARPSSSSGRSSVSLATSTSSTTGESSPASVMAGFLNRLITRVQAHSRVITAEEILNPTVILREQQTITFNTNGSFLEKASDALLDFIMQHQSGATIYAGLQRLSRLKTFETRYRALLETAERVYLFGIEDIPIWTHPKLHVIRLRPPASSLDRFWYILCNNEQLRTVLLAEQMGSTADSSLANAHYKGFWTFEPQTTKEAATILDQAAAILR